MGPPADVYRGRAPDFDDARRALAQFAEPLAKSPEHIHTYRISPVSLRNATAAGLEADEIAVEARTLHAHALM
jgi:DNA excision repair protein ERCC-3